ncbi:hypothetical protein H0O77_22665 [Escherichia coli]|nr:hypothetical protein [Escherichia coli]
MDCVHHIWCPLFSQEFQDLPDGAETTLTNVLPVLYGEMRVGSRVVSQEISTADEGDGGQVVVIGR